MKHFHEKTGQYYEVGKLVDFDGCNYDMCVITKWTELDDEDDFDMPQPPVLVDYYFGDYDSVTTDYYIDRWLGTEK